MAGYRLLESRDLSQAAGFLRACLSRAQHRTAGVEAAAWGDVSRIWRLACQNLVGPATTDLREGARVAAGDRTLEPLKDLKRSCGADTVSGVRYTHVALHRPPAATLVHTLIDR